MRTTVAAMLLAVPLAACGGSDQEQRLTVLAAASLTETFTELAEVFEDEHPGVEVQLVLGASSTLAVQAVEGAPGDVLATADERSMDVAEDGNAVADGPYAFASNGLALVTPPDNPAGITSLADLDDAEVRYVVCADPTPCGAMSAELLRAEGVDHEPASQEVDVKAVLAKVLQGEADAGLVYRTDAGGDVSEAPLPEAEGLAANYFVAPLHGADAEQADLAAEFVTLVRSNRARDLLVEAGFGSVVRE